MASFRTLLSRLALQNSHEQALSNGSNPRGAGPTCLLKPGALTLGAKSSIPCRRWPWTTLFHCFEDRLAMLMTSADARWKVIVLDWLMPWQGPAKMRLRSVSSTEICVIEP